MAQHMHSQAISEEPVKQTKASCLEQVLCDVHTTRQCFADFLEANDILQLLLVNRIIKKAITDKPDLLNRLYYSRMLNLDKTLYYDFYYEEEVLAADRRRISMCCSNPDMDLSEQIKLCSFVYGELIDNIEKLLKGNTSSARNVVDRIFHIFREPDLPLPKLRKDNIGNYCQTSLQTLMALVNWEGRKPEPLEEPFLTLKRAVIEASPDIIKSIEEVPMDQLVQLRHRSQLIIQYKKTNSPFVNAMSLIILLSQNHVKCCKKLVKANSKDLYEWLTEFNLRFCIFRYTLIELEEQLGFLFQHFTYVFDLIAPRYSIDPQASIWRIMLKQWVTTMADLHPVNTQICGYLLLKEREAFLKELSEYEQDIFNSQSKCQFLKAKQPSLQYHKSTLPEYAINQYFENQGSCYREVLLRDYRQYAVDVSVNQSRVHWLGHSNHSVSELYIEFEKGLIITNQQYFYKLVSIFGNNEIVKTILQKEKNFLSDRLKLTTLLKMVRQINGLLECNSQNQQAQTSDGKPTLEMDIDDFDEEIDFLNQQIHNPRQLSLSQKLLMDLNQHIPLELIQRIAKEKDEQQVQQQDGDSIESYISSENQ